MAHPDNPMIGTCAAIGIAVNAIVSGRSWDQTPDTMVWFYPNADTVKYRPGDRDVVEVADICRYGSRYALSGKVSSGSFEIPVSYVNNEKILQLMAAGVIGTVAGTGGDTGNYTHTPALSAVPRYGKISHFNKDSGIITYGDSFTNMKLTNLQHVYSAEQEPAWKIDWIAQTHTEDTTPAAPTISAFSPVDWKDMIFTLNSVVYRVNGLTWGLADAVSNPYASSGAASAHAGEVAALTPNAPMVPTLNVDLLMDSNVKTNILDNQGTLLGSSSTNSIVYDNGLTGADRGGLTIVVGSLLQNGVERVHGTVGNLSISIPFLVKDATTPFGFSTINALAVIPS